MMKLLYPTIVDNVACRSWLSGTNPLHHLRGMVIDQSTSRITVHQMTTNPPSNCTSVLLISVDQKQLFLALNKLTSNILLSLHNILADFLCYHSESWRILKFECHSLKCLSNYRRISVTWLQWTCHKVLDLYVVKAENKLYVMVCFYVQWVKVKGVCFVDIVDKCWPSMLLSLHNSNTIQITCCVLPTSGYM